MIIPAILETTQEAIRHKLQLLDGHAPLIQIDIADGILVDGKTVTELDFLDDLELQTKIQLHLMVQNPEAFLINLPAKIKDVCVQIEALMNNPPSLESFHTVLKARGNRIGLAFNFGTPFEDLQDQIKQCDYIQLNTIVPGGQGRSFIPEALNHITAFRQKYPDVFLQVDGGISETNLTAVVAGGANAVVIGSAIFNSPNPVQSYQNCMLQFESAHTNLLHSRL